MTGTPLIHTRDVTVRYNSTTVLDGVTLQADAGTLIGLIGPNGAGKTTLIKTLAGLITPDAGVVSVDGEDIRTWRRPALARAVGYLSQNRTVHWPVTVERLVSLGRLPHRGPWDSLSPEDTSAVESALAKTDVEHLRHRTITTLSGGELARVLLARVLAGEPRILLADEPVSGLDPGHRFQVLDGLKAMSASGRLVIAVMHDLTLASRYCDRLVLLDQGRVFADGTADSVLTEQTLTSVYGVSAAKATGPDGDAIVPWPLSTKAD